MAQGRQKPSEKQMETVSKTYCNVLKKINKLINKSNYP